jgi:RHS repeat-associated protein
VDVARADLSKRNHYAYDLAGRITDEQLGFVVPPPAPPAPNLPVVDAAYTLDPVLNITRLDRTESGATVTTTGTPDTRNRVTQWGSEIPSWDADGNLTAFRGSNLSYGMDNHLTKATLQNGDAIELLYDADGRKVRETKTVGGTKVETDAVQAGQQVIETYPKDGTTPTSVFVHGRGIDEVVQAELDPTASGTTTSVYPLQDELGNVTHLTDQNGNVLERCDYEGYGKFRIFDPNGNALSTSAYGWHRLFQGREYIPMLDAYDFRARTLWPELGRFGQEDPLGAVDSTNLYQALGGRWPTATDPKGHLTIVVHGTWARDDGVDSVEGPRNPSPFYPGGELFDEVRRDTRDYKYISFQWSGSDTDTARVIAAHYLAEKIKRYKFKPDEPLRFVTHSHGGNVVFKAIELGLGRPVDDFVSLSQPFRPDCPAPSVFQVKNFIQVTNDWDPVQNRGGNTIKVPFEIGKASVTTSADHYVTFSWFGLPGAAHAYTRRPEVFRKYLAGLIQPRRLEGKPDEPPTAVWAH